MTWFSTEVKFGFFIPCVMWQVESLVGFLSGFADLTPAVKNDYKYLIQLHTPTGVLPLRKD